MHAHPSLTTPTRSARDAWLRPLAVMFAGALVLTGCSTDESGTPTAPTTEAAAPIETTASAPENADQSETGEDEAGDEPIAEDPPSEPVATQEESCGWDAPGLSSGSVPEIPTGQVGDLDTVIIGAWQHTHFDSGAGYESLDDKDIRYVFPSTDRMLYCQHVPGITEYAENAGDISWKGTGLVLPNGSVGYTVTAWNDHVMVWDNHLDGSQYVLQRR